MRGADEDPSHDQYIRTGLTVFHMTGGHMPTAMVELVRTVLAEAAAGRLHPVIGQTFVLERAADAHFAIEEMATIGNTLLLVGANARDVR